MFEAFISRATAARHCKPLVVAAVAASFIALHPMAAAAQAPQLTSTYTVELTSVDGSLVTGSARLTTTPSGIEITVDAFGTSPGREHPIALHRGSDEAARCPRPSDDRNDDGFVTGSDLARVAGPALVTVGNPGATLPSNLFILEGAESADGDGRLQVRRTLAFSDLPTGEIGSLRLVIYGNDLNFSNRYERGSTTRPDEATIAVACGEVRLAKVGLPAPFAGSTGTAGTVTRLYVSVLERSPESEGHAYFVSRIDSGASSIDVVWAMASSPEFTKRFGAKLSASSGEWVDFVYRAIFGRRADTPGRQYWISELQRGGLEREAMLFYLSESTEFRSTTGTS